MSPRTSPDVPVGDTIAALSSGRPPAAVAIIRTSGPKAQIAAEALAGALPPPREAAVRTLRDPRTGAELDSALLIRFDSPRSATGEDIVEYQCHGGRAVVAAVLDALTSFGLRLADPGEFTRRALANDRIDFTEAEGLADLLEAETESQRRSAMAMASGALSRQVEIWQSTVLVLSARAEAAIDYVGDEDETATDLTELALEAKSVAGEVAMWLARPRVELLKEGVRVVIAGPPNAGKSSLANALSASDRSIVTAMPGTTRDSIEIPISVAGVPLMLVDTAGLRATEDPIEAIGVVRACDQVRGAEILLWLGDSGSAPSHPNVIAVQSKCDLLNGATRDTSSLAFSVSSITGEGMASLLEEVLARAVALLPAEGSTVLNNRQALLLAEAASLLSNPAADILLFAEELRSALVSFDRLTGRAGVEDAIDMLFSRFCLGK